MARPDVSSSPRLPAGSPSGASSGSATLPAAQLRPLVIDARLFGSTLAVLAVGAALWLVRSVLVTLLFVAVVTFLGAPVVSRLERHVPRALASGMFIAGTLLIVLALLALVVPPLVSDLSQLLGAVPALLRRAGEWAQQTLHVQVPTSWSAFTANGSPDLLKQVLPLARGSTDLVTSGALGVLQGAADVVVLLAQAFLVPVLAFFALAELPGVKELASGLVPRVARPVLGHYLPLVETTLSKLVRGQLLVALLMAVLYVVGLSVAGVPFALGIGALSGAFYLVPFASGAVCIALSSAFILLELDGSYAAPLAGAVAVVLLVQLLEGYVLTPRIVGREAGLSPLAAVLAVLLGGAAAGFLGVLFALPVGAITALILREESRRRGGLLIEHSEAST